MKNKIFTKLLSMFLLVLIIGTSIPLQAFASNNNIYDYSAISQLNNKYSYGSVFISDATEFILTENNTASQFNPSYNGNTVCVGAKKNEIIEIKITKSAIDADGDICDVICRTSTPSVYNTPKNSDRLAKQYFGNEQTEIDNFTFVALTFSKYSNSDLLHIWFNTVSASSHFSMKYVKAGTNINANIKGNVTTLYDMDASVDAPNDNFFDGQEFVTLDNADGNVYYKADGLWLKEIPENTYGKGVIVPARNSGIEMPFIDTNTANINNSVVFIENFNDATYRMFYGGFSCGIAFSFVSPYPFEIDTPLIKVDKNRVFEGEKFNYSIQQYIPNNYYANELKFISTIVDNWKDITITNTLNENLDIVGDITIINGSKQNVTSYFDITIDGNKIDAKVKSSQLSKPTFYSHLYTINVPVSFKYGTGKKIGSITNKASTIIDDNSYDTNIVSTALKYRVNTEATIDNGTIKVNEQAFNLKSKDSVVVNHNEEITNNITFQLENGYELQSVKVNDKNINLSDVKLKNGVYSYSIKDKDVTEDISHSVVVTSNPKDALVSVNYVDTEGNKLADSITIEGKVFDDYVTEEKNIPYYSLTAIPDNAVGKMNEEGIIVNYIYSRNKNTVTINYLEQGTNKKIADTVVSEYLQGNEYNVNAEVNKKINYYTNSSVSGDEASGIIDGDKVINVYYTRNQNRVVVNFIDWETKKVISPFINKIQEQGTNYDVSVEAKKDIPYYTYYKSEGNFSGILMDNEIINSYYVRNENNITIKYVDKETGNELEETVTRRMYQGTEYDETETANKAIYGYNLDSVEGVTKGFITEDVEIIVYYTIKDTSVIANYKTETGEELTDSITINGKVWDSYTTENKIFYGYELIEVPSNANGTMAENIITVDYIYRLKDTSVVANYKTETGEELAESITVEGKVFDEYTTENKTFYGYEIVEVPSNASGEMTEDVIVVDYIYRLKDTSIVANYKTETGEELAESITVEGKVFDEYTTENKTFYGYELIEVPSNASGTMAENIITVDYIYRLKDTSVVANYKTETGEELAESITVEGKVFDDYTTENKTFYGYELIEVPSNASGTMAENIITVDYIYRLKDTSVVANYKTETGEELAESITVEGKVFDEYTTENKTFYGYELVEVPSNASGTMTEDAIVVDYIYRLKPAKVIVKYVDTEGEELTESITIEGKVFDEYVTEQKNIDEYDFVKATSNTTGTMTEAEIEVVYTYTRTVLNEIEVDAVETVDTGDIVNIARMVILCVLLVTFIIGIVLIAKNNKKKHRKSTK